MKDAGFGGDSNQDLLYSMMFLCVVNTVSNFVGLSISSKYGRRELMLKCTIPMGIALLVMAGAMIVNAAGGGGTCKTFNNALQTFSYWLDLHCMPLSIFDVFLHRVCGTAMDCLRRNFPSALTRDSKFNHYHNELVIQLPSLGRFLSDHKHGLWKNYILHHPCSQLLPCLLVHLHVCTGD